MTHLGFYVDIRPALCAFDPMRSHGYYYNAYPALRTVVAEVTVQRIIECVFVIPAHDLQENGLTSVLYEYVEHQCPRSMDIFEADSDILNGFDCLISDITEYVDLLLKQALSVYTDSYTDYVFENWVTPNLAAFVRLDHES